MTYGDKISLIDQVLSHINSINTRWQQRVDPTLESQIFQQMEWIDNTIDLLNQHITPTDPQELHNSLNKLRIIHRLKLK